MDEIRLAPEPEYINRLIKEKGVDTNLISDGYHTFGELYEHRITLYIALCKLMDKYSHHFFSPVWASKLHSDGTAFEGWFILGMDTDDGQISYHLPMSKWDEVLISIETLRVLDKAPDWDGHTSNDVLKRIAAL
jgi:hypothetical protein